MNRLLAPNHPTYLRRLARELSSQPAGFYHDSERWSRATFVAKTGNLRIWRTIEFRPVTGTRIETFKEFGAVSQDTGPFFEDGNGNNIYASRQ